MFKLIKLNDDRYAVIGPKVDFEGTKTATIGKLVSMMIEDEEIAMGMEAVEIDEYAEYGIFGRFIYSSNFNRKGA